MSRNGNFTPARTSAPGATGDASLVSEVVVYAEDSGSAQEPLVHATERRSVSKDALRAVVCEWTRMLKASGLPPEKALVAVKTLVKDGIAPHLARYSAADPIGDRIALMTTAAQWCIEAYFDSSYSPSATMRGDAKSKTGNTVARKSLSRQLLLKLVTSRPDLTREVLASRLSVEPHQLARYESGAELMPYDVQESLAAFVTAHESRLTRLAHRLRLQLQAARCYEAGEVVRHMTAPRPKW